MDDPMRFVLKGLDRNRSSIKLEDISIHIHPDSDAFDGKKNFVGLIVYLCKDQREFEFNGKSYRIGDIFIRESEKLLEETKNRSKRKSIHNKLFYSIFGRWKRKKLGFVGGGFSYFKKKWKFNSGTLNTMNPINNDDNHHNTDRKMNSLEVKMIRKACAHLYVNHKWLSMPPDFRVNHESLEDIDMSHYTTKSATESADSTKIHIRRQFYGTVESFHYYRGYGFIKCIGFNKRIFVHHSAIIDQPYGWHCLYNGQNVLFNVVKGDRGLEARNIITNVAYVYTY